MDYTPHPDRWRDDLTAWLESRISVLPDAAARAMAVRGCNVHKLTTLTGEEYAKALLALGVWPGVLEVGHWLHNVPTDLPYVLDLHAQGFTPREIAAKVDTSRSRIYWLLKKRGLRPNGDPGRAPQMTAAQTARIVGLHESGQSMATIGRLVGVSYDQVRYLIKKEHVNG